MKVVEFKNVFFKFQDSKDYVIKNLNLQIEEGEFVCILGQNGGGKSTFARLIDGLLQPTKGFIYVYDLDTSLDENINDIRSKVGMVFQNPDNQMVATIIEDDIAFGPENLGIPPIEIGERIDFALNTTSMQEYRYGTSSKLSGGQKQRIAIAGVLAIKPKILILDESTSMLDPKGRKEVMDVVKQLNKEGMTIISITHYMDEAIDASRVVVINNGEVVMDGKPEEIFNQEEKIKEYGLDLPRSVYIKNQLRRKGVPLNDNVLSGESLEEELCKLFRKV